MLKAAEEADATPFELAIPEEKLVLQEFCICNPRFPLFPLWAISIPAFAVLVSCFYTKPPIEEPVLDLEDARWLAVVRVLTTKAPFYSFF